MHLWVQADNTTAFAKNAVCLKFVGLLIRKYKFRTASINFLPVGHTHEDVDQVHGILLALVLRRFYIKTPKELVAAVQKEMASIAAARNESLGAFLLDHVRNFETWMDPMHIAPYNAGCLGSGMVTESVRQWISASQSK